MNGYVCTYRKILDWEWFKDSHTFHVFMFLILNANWTTAKWKGVELQPGQLITSVNSICAGTGTTPRSVRTCLNRLISTNEITIKTTNKYSLITIANWALYQSDVEKTTNKTTSNLTNERQTNDKQTTTDKEYNKNKEEDKEYISMSDKPKKQVFTPPTVEEVTAYCVERNNHVDPQKFCDFYESKGWMVGKTRMKDWKASVRTWEKNGDNSYVQKTEPIKKRDPIQEELEKPGTIFIDIEKLMREGGIDGLDGFGKQERKNW